MKINKSLSVLFLFVMLVSSCEKEDLSTSSDSRMSTQELGLDDDSFLSNDYEILQALGLDEEAGTPNARSHSNRQSAVYTISNEVAGNRILTFNRNGDGTISASGSYTTGGTGTDEGLGNQGALALSTNGLFLFAVNPGSDDFSFFYIRKDGSLKLIDKTSSGGSQPISITVYGGLIYVLNAGGTGNVTGFAVNRKAKLVPITNSTRALSTDASGPAQVSFSGNGKAIVITEKATNTITSFAINSSGIPGSINTRTAAGITPFGFSFGRANIFHVSEAAMGNANESTVSSYHVNSWGKVTLLDGPFPTNGSAACWVVATRDGRTLFTTNTQGPDITSLAVDNLGKLSLSNGGEPTLTEAGPLDAALDNGSKYLYVLSGGNDAIVSYEVGSDGALTEIDSDGGLPDRASGLVVGR